MNNKIVSPIRPGFFPDPSIICTGNDYYMVNSSFIYFPCIPISHSTDLVHWKIVGHAVTDPSYIDMSVYEPGRGFWAPDISYSNGWYYIAVTLRGNDTMEKTHRQMIVRSKNPEGPYSKPVFIDIPGIDPSLFHDDDGKHYMLLNTSVAIVALSDDCLSATGPKTIIHEGWSRWKTEGPHIIKKDGYYYLFMAEGGTGDGHMITVARSESLYGPYENAPHNPLLTQCHASHTLQRTGHGKPFMGADGNLYIVYLCARKRGGKYSLLGRETALGKITWDKEGWPHINDDLGPLETIDVTWDTGDIPSYSLSADLSKPLPPDFVSTNGLILTRQTSIDCNVSLSFTPSDCPDGDRGLTFYYDENSYIRFGIETNKDTSVIYISEKNTDVSADSFILWKQNLDFVPKTLLLSADTIELSKDFYIKIDNEPEKPVHHEDNLSLLTDEGLTTGKRFTGPMIGTYNTDFGTLEIHLIDKL